MPPLWRTFPRIYDGIPHLVTSQDVNSPYYRSWESLGSQNESEILYEYDSRLVHFVTCRLTFASGY